MGTTTKEKTSNKSNNNIKLNTDIFNSRQYNVSIRALRGGRLYMEDEYFATKDGNFVAVFDGHGGSGVSKFLKDSLYDKLISILKNNNNGKTITTTILDKKRKY